MARLGARSMPSTTKEEKWRVLLSSVWDMMCSRELIWVGWATLFCPPFIAYLWWAKKPAHPTLV